MKKKIILLSFFFFVFLIPGYAQSRYSIDTKKKERKIPIKYLYSEAKNKFIEARIWRKTKRIENKNSRKTRKKTYNHQTKKVKKRMKRSEKKAQIFNSGKIPMSVKLKKIIYKWTI